MQPITLSHMRDLCRLSTGRAGSPWPEGCPGPALEGQGPGQRSEGPAPNSRAKGQLELELALGVGPGQTRTDPSIQGERLPIGPTYLIQKHITYEPIPFQKEMLYKQIMKFGLSSPSRNSNQTKKIPLLLLWPVESTTDPILLL